MPEQEGRKGADGAMVAGEGVVRRVVQEVIAYAGDKRPIVRIEVADVTTRVRLIVSASISLNTICRCRPHSHNVTTSRGTIRIEDLAMKIAISRPTAARQASR